MSKYYFFTDSDTFSSTRAFGPDGVYTGRDQFRVTSMHDKGQKAYAVCKGIVFVQFQDGSSTHVNIILKPLVQPPFELPKVKYFIYKGINANSLFKDGDIASAESNDLTASVWADYSGPHPGETPEMDSLTGGITSGVSSEELLDPVFFRTDVNFQLPVVQAGWHIGDFQEEYGFEIMMDNMGFEPTLELARNFEHWVRVPVFTSGTQAEFFEHWHDKEDILNYLDPAAFFGGFMDDNLQVRFAGGGTPGKDLLKGQLLFDAVLRNFISYNKYYIDIRNDFNYSLNYFKNYGHSPTDNATYITLEINGGGRAVLTITATAGLFLSWMIRIFPLPPRWMNGMW